MSSVSWEAVVKSVLLGILGFCSLYWNEDLARRHIDRQDRFWRRSVIAVTESNVLVYRLFILFGGITALSYSVAGVVEMLTPHGVWSEPRR